MVISSAPVRRDERGAKQERSRLVIAIQVTAADGTPRAKRALIDSGAKENCVRQALVVERGWEPEKGADTGLSTLEGKEVWTYETHWLDMGATDGAGTSRTARHRFVACGFDGLDVNLILGYPWLADIDPAIGYREGTWQFPTRPGTIQEVGQEEFYEDVQKAREAYGVLAQGGLGRRRVGVVTVNEAHLPGKYGAYGDVFDAKKAGVLPEHHSMEHRIEVTEGKEPP